MSICAVIPAAGRGTRLGGDLPKILTPLTARDTIWSILFAKLTPLVDHIHLVLSSDGAKQFPALPANVSVSIQAEPTGMGDAIFRGFDAWSEYDAVLIVWGDQVFVSANTLSRTVAALEPSRLHAVLPVTRMATPYVEYVFDGPRLARVLQTREGDTTSSNGFSDVGTFLLGTKGLKTAWEEYLKTAPRGRGTDEINFLPFLPFLSRDGWTITPLEVADATEARGINTKDDLAFFQSLYNKAP
ncbi:MAG TPA: NTP transferase domain-containing protein [Rhizomicrobium sp.]|jgi:bifunctional N-acetylglucosamine-1-phosphate-uridyltransferase/glucosamine-1-phosphate-acetyltransferase GlmU-like protein